MKICPTCSQTYDDDTLNFCLTDGAVLMPGAGGESPDATLFMSHPPPLSTPGQANLPTTAFETKSNNPTEFFGDRSNTPTEILGNQSNNPTVAFGGQAPIPPTYHNTGAYNQPSNPTLASGPQFGASPQPGVTQSAGFGNQPTTSKSSSGPWSGQQSENIGENMGWNAPQPHVRPMPRPRSRAPIWIAAGLVGFGFVGLVVVVALVALLSIHEDGNNKGLANTSGNSAGNAASDNKTVLSEDFSNWKAEANNFGRTEYRDGEYLMTSKSEGFYYVLISTNPEYKTRNASSKLTVRNVNGSATRLGYGLLVHNNPSAALANDYAFLINSNTQSYRVSMHVANKEVPLINWTKFSAIRSGSAANEIEVKDSGGIMTLLINGQQANSVANTTNYYDGVVGIYAGDGIKVAFSKLQISK